MSIGQPDDVGFPASSPRSHPSSSPRSPPSSSPRSSNSLYKDAVVARTLDFAHLSGQDVEKTKQLSDELKVKPLEECVKTLEDFSKSVDVGKILEQINNGLARDPEGSVDNPLGTRDNMGKDPVVKQLTKDQLNAVFAYYIQLRMQRGQETAEQWLDMMVRQGQIPRSQARHYEQRFRIVEIKK